MMMDSKERKDRRKEDERKKTGELPFVYAKPSLFLSCLAALPLQSREWWDFSNLPQFIAQRASSYAVIS
jgi:hypothetical protein